MMAVKVFFILVSIYVFIGFWMFLYYWIFDLVKLMKDFEYLSKNNVFLFVYEIGGEILNLLYDNGAFTVIV